MRRDHGGPESPRGGRVPPEVYRRRRAAVAAAGLTLVGLFVWVVSAAGGEGATETANQQPAAGARPAAQTSGRESASPSPTPRRTVTVTASPTVTVTATPQARGKPCREAEVRVRGGPDKKAYGPKSRPMLEVRVTANRRCVLDPDALELLVRTEGADDPVWSSADCPGVDRWPRRVEPGRPYLARVPWGREHSNPGKCGKATRKAEPGWYTFVVEFGDARSRETVFRLK